MPRYPSFTALPRLSVATTLFGSTVASAMSPATPLPQAEAEVLIPALLFGLLLAIGAAHLLRFASTRNRLHVGCAAFATSAGLAIFGFQGLTGPLLWPAWPWWNAVAPLVFGYLAIVGVALFTRGYLRLPGSIGRGWTAGATMLAALAGIGAVGALGPFRGISAEAFPLLALLAGGLMTLGAFRALRVGFDPARWLLLAGAALLPGLLTLALERFGGFPVTTTTLYGLQVGSVLTALLLSQALSDAAAATARIGESAQSRLLATQAAALEAQEETLAAARRTAYSLETQLAERTEALATLGRKLEGEIIVHRHTEEQLRRLSHHDTLTGLPNRTLLQDRFAMAASAARRNHNTLALLVIDLDAFRRINEIHGHDVGDDLLKAFAEMLRQCLRAIDTVARLGADEFVVLANIAEPDDAARVAEKVLTNLEDPVRVAPGLALKVSASIGIAVVGRDGHDLDALLRHGEAAMYGAKNAGRNTWRQSSASRLS